MRIVMTIVWLALLAQPVVAADATRAATPAPAKMSVENLAWLEGVWTGVTNGVAMEEHWSSPAGGGLIGMHKDTKGGRIVSYEFFRIVPGDSSGVCYLTSPNGRPPITFCAIELTASRVVFENLAHDFPQRILYWLGDAGTLHARIEGMIGGKLESEEWAWSRRANE
ncbi:MAG: DUF6265 family protein [bacterium]